MIIYFYEGGGSIVFENGIYPIMKGGMCFLRSGKHHYTLPDSPEKYDRSKIYISEDKLERLFSVFDSDDKMLELLEGSSVIYAEIPEEKQASVELIFERAAESLAGEVDSPTFVSCFLSLLIYLRDFSSEHIPNPTNGVTRAIDFVNRSYSREITLDDICREAYISKYHLCRSFRCAVGMTVMEYLLKTRISAAKNYLETTSYSIGEISEKCGFSSASYFSQIFKKTFGVTSRAYRKSHNKNFE